MFPHIARAQYRTEYKIWLQFEDGAEGIVDLKNDLDGPVFEPLQDTQTFKTFKLDSVAKTLVWPNGADFAPEYLKNKLTG